MIRPVMEVSFEAEYTFFNTSKSISILYPVNTGKLLILVRWSKIRKDERSGKMKTKFFPKGVAEALGTKSIENRRFFPTSANFTFVNRQFFTNVLAFFSINLFLYPFIFTQMF